MTELRGWKFAPLGAPGPAVITIDPGKHTGVATMDPEGGVYACEGTWGDTLDYVQRCLVAFWEANVRPAVVSEAFTITQQTASNTQAPWSLEGIGAVRFMCRRYGLELETQLPVEAKKFATNPRLKAQGWYVSTPGGHVNDALRHLYLYLAKRGLLVPPAGVI